MMGRPVTDLDRLLWAVCADPADDTARLAYADALEERSEGDDLDRALFIRTQVALAGLPDTFSIPVIGPTGEVAFREQVPNPQYLELAGRISHLTPSVQRWEMHWCDSLPPRLPSQRGTLLNDPYYNALLWSRGFIALAQALLPGWLLCGPQSVRTMPLERIDLLGRRPHAYATPADWTGRTPGYAYFWAFSPAPADLDDLSTLPAAWRPFFAADEQEFPDAASALAAANRAGLDWARAEAGLPALDRPITTTAKEAA